MISLLSHNSGVHIYVIGPDIQSQNRFLLEQTARLYGGDCTVLNIPDFDEERTPSQKRWPVFTIMRLFVSKIVPDTIKRILYLDSDTFITNNIDKLWDFNMQGKLYCGVKDCIGKRYKRNIGLDDSDPYINGGVFLADLEALRNIEISSSIRSFFRKHFYAMSYFDQDVLNHVFRGKIGILPPEYNVMTTVVKMEYDELCILRRPSDYYSEEDINFAKEYPCIIHFSSHLLSIRPWYKNSEHPYAKAFQRCAGRSPWKEHIGCKSVSFHQKVITAIFHLWPAFIKKPLLYILGFLHAVWYPELRHLKNRTYINMHKNRLQIVNWR